MIDINNLMRFHRKYHPLIIIVIISLALSNTRQVELVMVHFMGYFLVLLAMFKLFDVRGFSNNFRKYDEIAKRYHYYGDSYPFLEFLLGLSYLSGNYLLITNILVIVMMSSTMIGIIKIIRNGEELSCACMGTTINLPLSTVSIVESGSMIMMAMVSLF